MARRKKTRKRRQKTAPKKRMAVIIDSQTKRQQRSIMATLQKGIGRNVEIVQEPFDCDRDYSSPPHQSAYNAVNWSARKHRAAYDYVVAVSFGSKYEDAAWQDLVVICFNNHRAVGDSFADALASIKRRGDKQRSSN